MVGKASTVSEAFSIFSSNLEPNEGSTKNIIKRHTFIRETFSKKIICDGRIDSFLSGSYARHTQIEPVNDVDIVIVFDINEYWKKYSSNARALLEFTRDKISETYSTKDPQIQSHSVGIKFESIPDVDLVPAFIFDYDNDIYWIPDYDSNRYVKTSPRTHQSIFSEHNDLLQKKFIPLIKMMKCWRNKLRSESRAKYGEEIKIKSFHLETLLYKILDTTFTNYPHGLLKVFDNLGAVINQPCIEPADLGGELGTYLSPSSKYHIKKISNDLSTSINNLIVLQNAGDHESAIRGWQQIFGESFPSPMETDKKQYKKDSSSTNFPKNGQTYGFGEF